MITFSMSEDDVRRALRHPRGMIGTDSIDISKGRASKYGIKLVFGRPYPPKGRGKVEGYHKALWKELIMQVRFSSLTHFRRELRKFDRRYNYWRKHQSLGWKTPAEIYNDERYLNKRAKSMMRRWT